MSILDKATLHLPMGAAYKSGSVWMSKPLSDDGYFAYSRDSAATRITDCGEVGSVALATPRLNYTDGIPGLLIEDTKTNLVAYSNPNSSYWGKSAGATITANYGISLEGKINASRIQSSASNDYIVIACSIASGQTYTFSAYVKGTSGQQIRLYTDGSANINTEFTLDGTWQRFYVTVTTTSTSALNVHILAGYGSTNPARDFLVWGAQTELGSAPSSFIKTTGSTATRAGDSFVIANNRALPYIGGSQGTIYFYVYYKNNGGSYQQFMYYTDASASQSYMFVNSSRFVQTNLNLGSMQSSVQLVDGSFNKVAVKYMPGKQQMYINGQSVATATYGSILNHANVFLGSFSGSSEFSGMEFIEYAHFDQVLSNEEMISLTTL